MKQLSTQHSQSTSMQFQMLDIFLKMTITGKVSHCCTLCFLSKRMQIACGKREVFSNDDMTHQDFVTLKLFKVQ